MKALLGLAVALPFGVLIVLAAGLYGAFSHGFVMQQIWAWYLVPLGLPVFGWKIFAAIYWIRWLLFPWFVKPDDLARENDSHTYTAALMPIVAPWITLGIAWVIL